MASNVGKVLEATIIRVLFWHQLDHDINLSYTCIIIALEVSQSKKTKN